jgi:methionyl-tRNA formyltransferase
MMKNIYRKSAFLNRYFSTVDQPSSLNMKNKYSVLFFGNDEISLPTLVKLYEESFNDSSMIKKLGVVTTPCENKKSAQFMFHKFIDNKKIQKFELNLKSEETTQDSWRETIKSLQESQYNIGIVASFGKMLPGSIITSFKLGAYVMHPSLLPKYRGACPIQHTLLNEETKSGVSIVEASIGKFDAGDILLQREFQVERFHRFKELSMGLASLGAESVIEFLKNFDEFHKAKTPQNLNESTKAKLIKDNNFVYLDFITDSSQNVIKLYKAFYGSQLEPFSKLLIENKERTIFFENLFVVTQSSNLYKEYLNKIDSIAKPGSIYWNLKEDRNNIYIKSQDGWLVSTKIKLDGTTYLPGETIIVKHLKNRLYIEKEKTKEFSYTMFPKNSILNK